MTKSTRLVPKIAVSVSETITKGTDTCVSTAATTT